MLRNFKIVGAAPMVTATRGEVDGASIGERSGSLRRSTRWLVGRLGAAGRRNRRGTPVAAEEEEAGVGVDAGALSSRVWSWVKERLATEPLARS